jgi:hypothetical protein
MTCEIQKDVDAINVFIDGDKTCFISKSSIHKFKKIVKSPDFNINNINELSNKFMKPGYKLICYENKHNLEYKFKVCDASKDKLRVKIKEMSNARKNSNYHKAKTVDEPIDEPIDDISDDVNMADIYKEYNKLVKLSKIPIPEPKEILQNSDQYKSILSMVLGNDVMNKLGKNHPYVRYFTLLANKIGEKKEKVKQVDELLEIKQLVGNTIITNDDVDTEDED